jgi:deazaflavin-dependent oxidoreductase (nitroreductase family)
MAPQTEQQLRQGFKYFNRLMLLMWRLGLGRWINAWPEVGGQIMVLGHTGRKSGRRRFTPVNFARVNGELYCVAGFGRKSDWYRNIQASPEIEVWLPDGRWTGYAKEISNHPDRLSLLRAVLIGSGFAAHAAGLNPKTMSDTELEAATSTYNLLHIYCDRPYAGPGGPGELVWVWAVAAVTLGGLLLARLASGRRQSKRISRRYLPGFQGEKD